MLGQLSPATHLSFALDSGGEEDLADPGLLLSCMNVFRICNEQAPKQKSYFLFAVRTQVRNTETASFLI
jgi:hypothetical protein